MHGSTIPDASCLVVPIDVQALCVSRLDQEESTGKLAGATVSYLEQATGSCPAPLGQHVNRGFMAPPLTNLEAGVHLHWALPDALTQASQDGTSLDFPVIPNRWLVTRLLLDGASVRAASWVVVSDALGTTAPAKGTVTLAVAKVSSAEQNYRFLGRAFPLDAYDPGRCATSHGTLAALTGQGLTAVTTGVTSFTAYYPDCRSVLGFVDPLSDVAGAVGLAYVVTGWYADQDNDPATRFADLRASHRWSAARPAAPPPAATLYSGQIQGVVFDPKRRYLPLVPRPIAAEAALGATPAEALSAYFRAKNHPDIPYFERLLTALQAGLLPSLGQPAPDQMTALDETLHTLQFQSQDAGTLCCISQEGGETLDVLDLPPALAQALHRLGALQEAWLGLNERVASMRWNFYNDWYRFFEARADQTGPVFNHAAGQYARWSGVLADLETARQAVAAQTAVVRAMLAPNQSLREVPAPRYWRPAEPALLLAGAEVAMPLRYGGDTSFSPDKTLAVRHGDALVGAVTVGGQAIDGARFAAACSLPADKIPQAGVCSALLVEACLLNTTLAAAITQEAEPVLAAALAALLAGKPQTVWTLTSGQAPSPVEVGWWGPENPWLPVFVQWRLDYAPLFPTLTAQGALADYGPRFFTANYALDTETGSFVTYAPGTGPGSIPVDPATADYGQAYAGATPLLRSSAQVLAEDIEAVLAEQPDPALQAVLDQLRATPTMVQPLASFTDQLLLRQDTVQLGIAVQLPASYQARTLTDHAIQVVGPKVASGPQFSVGYNPIRAGYFKVSAVAVDVFGRKRPLAFSSLAVSETLAATAKGAAIPGIAYAAPRLSQPARLLFRWLAPDSLAEIVDSEHPELSPMVGWLLPNHLRRGFFLYDGSGKPLGMLQLDGTRTMVLWQPAPGDDASIDLPIAEALAGANPVLRAFALAWSQATAEDFSDFCLALETAHDAVAPASSLPQGAPGLLVGSPLGLAQAGLRLELRGEAARNQGWACLSPQAWTDTVNRFDAVRFPVALGDLDKLDDGLIGYFKPAATGYDYGTFYSDGAPTGPAKRVVRPASDTLLLTPAASGSGAPLNLLLLLDPRAAVHAVSGILPTQTLRVPADIVADAVSILEIAFPATPVLRQAAGLAMPLPAVPGFDIAWVQEGRDDQGRARWFVEGDIAPPLSAAVWAYTPQRLVEGWLRLNPAMVDFSLQNAAGQPVLKPGQVQSARIRVTNRKPGPVTFEPGLSVPEGTPPPGSVVYLHFGTAVAPDDVPALRPSAPGWRFACLSDSRYGVYWSAVADTARTLRTAEFFDIAVDALKTVEGLLQARLAVDYYSVTGVNDGVCNAMVAFAS